MEKPTLYLETTVPSYLLAGPTRDLVSATRQEITRVWWHRDASRFQVTISDVVLRECAKGDKRAAQKRLDFLAGFPVLQSNQDIIDVAKLYRDNQVVPFGSADDAAHLAFACVHQIQFLCTWNFKHIANAFAFYKLKELNAKYGLHTPQICTPEALLGE